MSRDDVVMESQSVVRQDLLNIMNRHTPTSATPMHQHLIRQRPDVPQRHHSTILHVLRKQADTTTTNIARQPERGALLIFPAYNINAFGELIGKSDRLELGDADDVVAVAVGGGVWFGRVPDGVAEDLGDAFARFVFEGGDSAHSRAAAVDAEGGGAGG